MRNIKWIINHCTATPQTTTIKSIENYWYSPKPHGNGWKNPGYHHIILPDGTVVDLLPIEKVSNGVAGHNSESINISYIGGIDKKGNAVDNRTPAQIAAQISLLRKYHAMFPDAVICGHRDFLTPGKPGYKSCPSYDVKTWLKAIKFYK